MPKKLTLVLIFLPILLPYLYTRLQVLHSLSKNHPSTLRKRGSIVESGNYEVKYKDVLRNCEDLVLDVETGTAVVGCDEGRDVWNTVMGHFNTTTPPKNGRLHLYTYDSPTPHLEEIRLLNLPQNYTFHPLGLNLHIPTQTLYIVNHGLTSSTLDIYSFSRHGNTATYIRSINSPYIRAPNAVEILSATEIVVSNDHYFLTRWHPWLAKLETYLALPLGGVVHIDVSTGIVTPIARIPFANGVALLRGQKEILAVASSSTGSVYLYDFNRTVTGVPEVKFRETVALGFAPDNLHTDGRSLLIAGHAHLGSFNRFCALRSKCGRDTESEDCAGTSPFFAVEWTEEGGVRELYVGDEVDTGSSVVRDGKRGVGIVSGLYGKGLLVWKQKK